VHDAVDEERRRPLHLTRRRSALDVTANPSRDLRARPILLEACEVEPRNACRE
jgi:hypothetical protein